jgi:hypothetical protein
VARPVLQILGRAVFMVAVQAELMLPLELALLALKAQSG